MDPSPGPKYLPTSSKRSDTVIVFIARDSLSSSSFFVFITDVLDMIVLRLNIFLQFCTEKEASQSAQIVAFGSEILKMYFDNETLQ